MLRTARTSLGSRIRAAVTTSVIAAAVVLPLAAPGTASAAGCPAPAPMVFGPQSYVDTTRAGGEPMIQVHPDGTLLYAAHAGTTHFYTPAGADPDTTAFAVNYEGQTYFWRSVDDGKTWDFVPRDVPNNVPLSGFSDPDFAVDKAGQVYLSEINLVNVAMSRSIDVGKSFQLQNFFGQVLTDRQWSEADERDVVYFVGNAQGPGGGTVPTKPAGNSGHVLYKSTDGGKTYTSGKTIRGGLGDLRVDQTDGTLYEANLNNRLLMMSAFRKARQDDLTPNQHLIVGDVRMRSHWPAIDVDPKGNVYIVWDETGAGVRESGVWYSYSKDRGVHWAPPIRVDKTDRTDIWPWIAVGDEGRVAISWFEAQKKLPNDNAEAEGAHGWRAVAAQTLNGLGCDGSPVPGFTVTTMTPQPIHSGTVCMGGTFCQAELVDRRLGDYFSIDIDSKGRLVGAYSDTRRGGSVSLPGFSRQIAGPSFLASGDPTSTTGTGTTVKGTRRVRPLPKTGLGAHGLAVVGLALLAGAMLTRRWTIRGV